MLKHITFIFCTVLLISCDSFENTPFSSGDEHRYLNQYNYNKLKAIPANDSVIKFAFIGDTQRFYDDTQDAVNIINTIDDLDFVIISGDLTDFGLLYEFEQMDEILSKLNVPYFSVIGNHDMVANGIEIFSDFYGSLNTVIEYQEVVFLLHNSNGISTAFDGTTPDIKWLQNQVVINSNKKWIVGVSHIAPNNVDFDPNLKELYQKVWSTSPNFLVSLHGHNHNMAQWQTENVDYINSSSPSKREMIVMTINDSGFVKSILQF